MLARLDPQLDPAAYLFCLVTETPCAALVADALMLFREAEGTTLILDQERARAAGVEGEGPYRRITLGVHSSLEAVGLQAAVAAALTDADISTNMVAAFHHDHVFVPAARLDAALTALEALADPAAQKG